jgi:hypothetical protein
VGTTPSGGKEQEEIIGDFVKIISEDTEKMKRLLKYDWIREQMEGVSERWYNKKRGNFQSM